MRPILITGAGGTLGQVFSRCCDLRGLAHHDSMRRSLDIGDEAEVADWIDVLDPWAVVNAAGYSRIDGAEREASRCRRVNTDGAVTLARACARRRIGYVTFSSHQVFDGDKPAPYREGDTARPLNTYGTSKADAEAIVLRDHPGALVVRSGALFGPWDERNFVTAALTKMGLDGRVAAPQDIVLSPTYAPDLAHACLDLLIDGASGLWHLANRGAVSWAELAREAARRAGVSGHVEHQSAPELGWRALRPRYSVLASERGESLPDLGDALGRYIVERRAQTDPLQASLSGRTSCVG